MIRATDSWLSQVKHVISVGNQARDTVEIMASQVRWDMSRPLVIAPNRGVNYKFAAMEAAYIITGQNRVSFLTNDAMKTFGQWASDDGEFQAGAYGPPFVDQLPYVIDCIKNDPETRQAVISIWRPRPYKSKDIPCTLTLQFLVRGGVLQCIVNMRSSDVWRGLVYDLFCFSCMAAVVAHYCGIPKLGAGYLHAGSSHLYNRDYASAISAVGDPGEYDDGPKLAGMDIDTMRDWLVTAAESGDNADCLVSLYGQEWPF